MYWMKYNTVTLIDLDLVLYHESINIHFSPLISLKYLGFSS